jgi:MFS transporter, FHS family, glucose/mannose:H+ symporter
MQKSMRSCSRFTGQTEFVSSKSLPPLITLIGFVSFIIVAALVAMFGPSLLEIQSKFSLSEAAAGFILTAHFVGTFVGTFATTLLQRSLSLRGRFIVAAVMIIAGSWVVALTSSWTLFLAATALRGFGAGVLFTDINGLFATGFGLRSTAMLSLVNAAYGAGSFLGPVLVGALPGGYRGPMLIGSMGSLIIFALALFTPKLEPPSSEAHKGTTAGSWSPVLLTLFLVALFTSGSVESTLGTWLATQLQADGFSKQFAANMTGFYWGAQTIARVLMAPLALRFSARQLLLAGFVLEVLAMALAHVPSLRIAAYILAGVGVAAPFTAGIAWLNQALPGLRIATMLGLVASLSGAASMSPITGQLIGVFSANVLPTVMLVLTLIGLTSVVVLWVLTRRKNNLV